MRILMFPQRSFPCDHAMLESIYARILPERGHEVHWIMRAADHDPRAPTRRWHGSTVWTMPLVSGSPLVNIRAALAEFFACRRQDDIDTNSFDIVQVRNEIGPSLAMLLPPARRQFAFVYQMSFPNAELRLSRARRGELRPRLYHTARARAELAARRYVLRKADGVLAISDRLRSELLSSDPTLDPTRVAILPLGFDASVPPAPELAGSVRRTLGFDGRPLAVYFGTISSARRLEFLVDVLASARREVPHLALLIIGRGADHRPLARAFERAGLSEGVVFTGALSRRETARHVAACDVSLVPMPPTPEFLSTSPTKLMESLGLGVPVVANQEVPESRDVVSASGGGLLVPYEAGSFGTAVARLVTDEALRARCACGGRQWILRHREYHILAAHIEAFYHTLFGRPAE